MKLYLSFVMPLKNQKEKCAAFLYIIGVENRIYHTFNFTEDERNKVNVLMSKFETYCSAKQNTTFGRHKFNTWMQNTNESVDQYVTELKIAHGELTEESNVAQVLRKSKNSY